MDQTDYRADERPALELTDKGRDEALKKLGPSARLYTLTPKGKAWLREYENNLKKEGAK